MTQTNDQIPLFDVEHAALMNVWDAFNCTNQTLCPRFASGQPCPAMLPPLQWSGVSRLRCVNGSVRELAMDKRNSIRFGSISPTIGALSKLTDLTVTDQDGGLTGTIPTEIGQLTQLKWLFLCCNDISGTIPSHIGRLSELNGLGLQQNALSGSIPLAVASLAKLSFVKLYDNQLSGTAPAFRGVDIPEDAGTCHITLTRAETNCFSTCIEPACCVIGPCVRNNVSRGSSRPLTQQITSTPVFTQTSPSALTLTSSSSSSSSSTTNSSTSTNNQLQSHFSSAISLAPTAESGSLTVILAIIGTALVVAAAITAIVCIVRRRRNRHEIVDGETLTEEAPRPAEIIYSKAPPSNELYTSVHSVPVPYENGNLEI